MAYWEKEVVGAITLVYDHRKRGLVNHLMDIQHDYRKLISTRHIHLGHNNNCLKVIVGKGRPREVEKLAESLKAMKGVKLSVLTMTTMGKDLV